MLPAAGATLRSQCRGGETAEFRGSGRLGGGPETPVILHDCSRLSVQVRYRTGEADKCQRPTRAAWSNPVGLGAEAPRPTDNPDASVWCCDFIKSDKFTDLTLPRYEFDVSLSFRPTWPTTIVRLEGSNAQ